MFRHATATTAPRSLPVLCALALGMLLGVVTQTPAQADEAPPPRKESSRAKVPPPDPSKGGAGAHCKTTADCRPSHLCSKVGDHKECTPSPSDKPIRPPMMT